ncbi:hypothetical protein CEUSTIGMA_g5744.t1 [Chlamydomonas eustigma]|uniref:Coenzyme Q-binding protein COQ10 START domain-containing protein n=1 Tax=Chlamydomonas eustigma TaxID=1157962 RepID=A0A250X5Y2_9CHLO|nr:hypothetical protein CEUSTIGMA_g5744.t1 [Chlamydomonas eustigma]|eukprot:GAX78302.1 hypothetical protein CEUSTIGMA_g5744.t1 [Chlamydomonas eustigma]
MRVSACQSSSRLRYTPSVEVRKNKRTFSGRLKQKSSYQGQALNTACSNGSLTRWRMSRWLENKSQVEVPVPLETAWSLWSDREQIPKWMPWIKSVKVQEDDMRKSKWTLSTHQFGRDWEFSWLSRNLQPILNQKIHWVSEPGSTSMPGIEIANRGQIRFVRKGAKACGVTLTISYELPDALVPFGNALTPLVEGILAKDMERFKEYALKTQELMKVSVA